MSVQPREADFIRVFSVGRPGPRHSPLACLSQALPESYIPVLLRFSWLPPSSQVNLLELLKVTEKLRNPTDFVTSEKWV